MQRLPPPSGPLWAKLFEKVTKLENHIKSQKKRARRYQIFIAILGTALTASVGWDLTELIKIPLKVEDEVGKQVPAEAAKQAQIEVNKELGTDVRLTISTILKDAQDQDAQAIVARLDAQNTAAAIRNQNPQLAELLARITVESSGELHFKVDESRPDGCTIVMDYGSGRSKRHVQLEEGGHVEGYEGRFPGGKDLGTIEPK